MLVREQKLAWNAVYAVTEILNLQRNKDDDLLFTRETVATIHALFFQEPSAPYTTKLFLLSSIVRCYYGELLPDNFKKWKYEQGLNWLSEQLKLLELVVANKSKLINIKLEDEALLIKLIPAGNSSLTFLGSLSDGANAYSREYEPIARRCA